MQSHNSVRLGPPRDVGPYRLKLCKEIKILKTKTKILFLFALLFIALLLLSSCSDKFKYGYDSEWIIGKKSSEIVERYGQFEYYTWGEDRFIDGEWRNAGCGYKTFEGTAGFLGTPPDEFYLIWFDSEGRARKIETDVPRMGG